MVGFIYLTYFNYFSGTNLRKGKYVETLSIIFVILITSLNQDIKAQTTQDEIIVQSTKLQLTEFMVLKHIQ